MGTKAIGTRLRLTAAWVALGLAVLACVDHRPLQAQTQAALPRPTARCQDGTYSYSAHHSGTCSWHGGVAEWLPQSVAGPTARSHSARQPTEPPGVLDHGVRCGVERWDVKTLSDADRDRVRLEPVKATIESLTTLQSEGRAPGGARYVPAELTVYQVEAYLAAANLENDGDWHLVLFDTESQRVSLITEIPDPRCSGAYDSGFADQYDRARQALE